jgi:hypothetical protein
MWGWIGNAGLPIRAALMSGLFVKGLRDACAADATDPIYLDLFHKVPLKRRIRPAQLLPEEKCHAQRDRGFFHY